MKTWLIVAAVCMCCARPARAETLSDVYALSLQNDTQLRAAQSAYLAGQESVPIARAALLPKLVAQANWTRSQGSTRTESSNPFAAPGKNLTDSNAPGYSVALTQPLVDLAALHDYRRGTAQAALAATVFESEKQALILRVADGYLQAITAGAKLAAAQSAEQALGLQRKAAKLKYDLGMARITAYLEAQAALDAAAADTLVAQNVLNLAFDAVKQMTGQELVELAALPEDFVASAPVPLAFSEWRDAALKNNHDLHGATLAVDAARENALGRAAEHLPRLAADLSYSDGYDRRNYDTAVPDKVIRRGVSVGLTLTLPLYSGGAVSASAREADFRYREQRDLRDSAERSVVQKTHASYLNVVSGAAAVSARKAAIVSSQSALEFAHKGFDEGIVDMIIVLDAEKNLVLARQNYADALYGYLIAGLTLKRSAGALGERDVVELDRRLDPRRAVRAVR